MTRLVPGTVVAITATAATLALIRRQSLRWGADDGELRKGLPGDELLSQVDLESTRAITIRASRENVWPWIAQLGQGRGGFYSFDALENLFGCDIHSADAVEDCWQDITAGDEVRLHPDVSLVVSLVVPGRALVLRGAVPMGPITAPYEMTWAFVLVEAPESAGTTRLIIRERYRYLSWWAALLVEPTELVSLAMSLRMLRGIKRRAESDTLAAPFTSLEASHV